IEVEQPTIIRHGVALDRFPPQLPHLLRRKCSDPYRILYSGRIVPEKGIVTLLKALARVRIVDGLRNTRLSLVGPPPGVRFADELAQALIWTLTHPDLVADIARVARTEVAQRYQLDSQIRSLEAYLQNSTGSATGAEQVAGSSVRKRTGTEGSVDDRIQIPSYK